MNESPVTTSAAEELLGSLTYFAREAVALLDKIEPEDFDVYLSDPQSTDVGTLLALLATHPAAELLALRSVLATHRYGPSTTLGQQEVRRCERCSTVESVVYVPDTTEELAAHNIEHVRSAARYFAEEQS